MSNSNTDTGDTNLQNANEDNLFSQPPREALITTAVNFLQNERLRNTSLQQKQKFLRSKGLTSDEIQIACERSGAFSRSPDNTVINMGINSGQYDMMTSQPLSTFGRIKEALHSMALISGVAYAIYLFYKKYIAPFLFGKKKKSVEETLTDLDEKVDTHIRDINRDLVQLKETVINRNENDDISRELRNFKSDLDAIKGLLLNRKQFANPIHTTVPPSIPAWQLTSSHHRHSHSETEGDKNDDAGSGSGSSETEVVTKNSDSSLEIM